MGLFGQKSAGPKAVISGSHLGVHAKDQRRWPEITSLVPDPDQPGTFVARVAEVTHFRLVVLFGALQLVDTMLGGWRAVRVEAGVGNEGRSITMSVETVEGVDPAFLPPTECADIGRLLQEADVYVTQSGSLDPSSLQVLLAGHLALATLNHSDTKS